MAAASFDDRQNAGQWYSNCVPWPGSIGPVFESQIHFKTTWPPALNNDMGRLGVSSPLCPSSCCKIYPSMKESKQLEI